MANWGININRLKDSELTFELESRGFTFNNVQEARNRISSVLKLEKEQTVAKTKSTKPYAEEILYITNKLTEISTTVNSFEGDKNSKIFKELSAKYNLLDRLLKRCNVSSTEEKKNRDHLLIQLTEIQNLARKSIRRFEHTSTLSTSFHPLLQSTTITDSDSSNESESENDDPLTVRTNTNHNATFKPCPVIKWGVTFSGECEQSVKSFLSRVDELKIARGINDAQLFASAIDLFSGKGLIWFRSIRATVNSWPEITRALIEGFQDSNYDERLYDEIRNRKQGKTENTTMFFAIMINLFSRLSWKIPETNKVRIIMNNLDPHMTAQLGFDEINTVKELRRRCKILETRKLAGQDFCSSMNITRPILEADLAYVAPIEPSRSNNSRIREKRNNTTPVNTINSNVTCWNCRQKGHTSLKCPAPQNVHCYGCGEPNVIRTKCPKCSGNEQPTGSAECPRRVVYKPRSVPRAN